MQSGWASLGQLSLSLAIAIAIAIGSHLNWSTGELVRNNTASWHHRSQIGPRGLLQLAHCGSTAIADRSRTACGDAPPTQL